MFNGGGVDVDQGDGVSSPSKIIVNGKSSHSESRAIIIDDIRKNVSVTDTNNQYKISKFFNSRIYSYVTDIEAPTITLNDSDVINIEAGGTYNEQGASVHDNRDTGLSAVITGNVDTSTIGTYIIEYNATDLSGNQATKVTRTVKVVDTIAPNTPKHISPYDNSYINYNDFWFDWDDVSDAVSYEMQNSTSLSTNNTDGSFINIIWTGDYQHIQPINPTAHSVGADGIWYWQIRAVDAAGNKSNWSVPWKITIDKTPPTSPTNLTFSTTDGTNLGCSNSTNQYNIIANWSASFDTNFSHYEYESYNPPSGTYVWGTTVNTNLYSGAFTRGEGNYGFRVKAVDKAGNVSAWTSENLDDSCQITYDKTAPIVTVSPIPGSILHGVVTFNITVTDTKLDPTKLKNIWTYLYNNLPPQASKGAKIDLSTGNATFTVDTTKLSDGKSTLNIARLFDAAGNASGVNDSYFKDYIIDNSAPTSTVSIKGNLDETQNLTGDRWYKNFTEVIPSLILGDTSSDRINYQIIAGDVSCPVSGYINYVSSGSNIASDINSQIDGQYSLCYYASDLAGNSESINKTLLKKDGTNPVFTIGWVSGLFSNNVYYNSSNVSVSVNVSDTLSGFSHLRYDLYNADENNNCTTYIHYNQLNTSGPAVTLTQSGLSDGRYCLKIWSYDNVQNKSWSDSNGKNIIKFVIDNTPPDITIVNPGVIPAHSKTLTASATDGTLKMAETRGTICDNSLSFIDYSNKTYTSESDNGQKICYQAQDLAGNFAYGLSEAINGIDWSAPIIATHENIIVAADEGKSGAIINYFLPTATDNFDSGVTVFCSPISGSFFPLETTTVTCNSTDSVGNSATPTTFTITVNDVLAPITTDSGTDSNWHSSDVTVALTCTDANSSCAHTYYSTDGSIPTTSSTEGNSLTLSAEGTYIIKYFSTDIYNNAESIKTAQNTVKIDKTNPIINISVNPISPDGSNSWYWTQPELTIGTTELNPNKLQYQWDSNIGSWTDYSSPLKPNTEGSHTLYVRAEDLAGNSVESSKEVKWDQTDLEYGPQNISANPNPTSGSTSKIKWEFGKDNVGIDRYEVRWSLDGTNHSETVGSGTTEVEIDLLTEGKWSVQVIAFDFSGRSKSSFIDVTVGLTGSTASTPSLTGTGVGTVPRQPAAGLAPEVKGVSTEVTSAQDGEVLGESKDTSTKQSLPLLFLSALIINIILIRLFSVHWLILLLTSSIAFVFDYLLSKNSYCYGINLLCSYFWVGDILSLLIPITIKNKLTRK